MSENVPADQGGEPQQEQQASGRDSIIAVHCENCRRRFRAKQWRDGMSCPKCRSGRVKPVVPPGGAVDYFVADRSKGYTPADIRFAQWAKWCEIITPSQYEKALLKQNRLVQDENPLKPIHEIMIEEGFLKEHEAVSLLEFMARPRPDADDEAFLQQMQQMADVDQAKVEEVKALQAKAAETCHEVPPICQLLVERRAISEGQMLAMLRFQQRRREGCLYAALEIAARHGGGKPGSGGAIPQISLKDPRVRYAGIVAGLLVLGLVIWLVGAHLSKEYMIVKCANCNSLSRVEFSTAFPVKCPICLAQKAHLAYRCEKGHIFVRKGQADQSPCPVCGTSNVLPLTEEEYAKHPH